MWSTDASLSVGTDEKALFSFMAYLFFENFGNFPCGLFAHPLAVTLIGALSPLIKPPVGHTLATAGPVRALPD